MRKILFGLSVLGTALTFSFHKMLEGSFFKIVGSNTDGIPRYEKILQNNLTKRFNNTGYYIYFYDDVLKYYLTTGPQSSINEHSITWHMFGNRKFDPQWWENKFDSKIELSDLIFTSFYNPELNSPTPEELNRRFTEFTTNNDHLWSCTLPYSGGYPFINATGEVTIKNIKDNVILSHSNKKPKRIEFQPALLKYMKFRKQQKDQLFEPTSNFARDFREKKLTQNQEFKTNSISKIVNLNKITYTQEQIDLLEHSKIVAILSLPSKKINNQKYVEGWNKRHPQDLKQVESKIISSIIIGFAYHIKDNVGYVWIVDLGEDISILYDYANKSKVITK